MLNTLELQLWIYHYSRYANRYLIKIYHYNVRPRIRMPLYTLLACAIFIATTPRFYGMSNSLSRYTQPILNILYIYTRLIEFFLNPC